MPISPTLPVNHSDNDVWGGELNTALTLMTSAINNSRVVNVLDYGVIGDGTADDTTAIQTVLTNYAATNPILFPQGSYKLSATLTVSNVLGPRLLGAGKRLTKLFGTTALAGLPVIQFTDCRDHTVENMQVAGTPSGTVATCAIQSFRSATSPTGGHTGTRLTVRSCRLGDDNFSGLGRGVQWAETATTADTNNDFGLLIDVEVSNFTVAAYDIGHANSLQHLIVGGVITGGPTAVKLAGGSFSMVGTRIGALTSFLFYFDTPVGSGTPAYYHRSQISALVESASPVIYAETTATNLTVAFVQYEHTSAPGGGATMIDWRAPGVVSFTGCTLDFGQPACVASFTSSSSHAKFIGNHGLGLTSYSYNGQLLLVGNTHIPGTVTPSNIGSGFLRQFWDDGGAFSNQGMTATSGLVLAGAFRMANLVGTASASAANSSTSVSLSSSNDHSGRLLFTTAAGLAADSSVATVAFGSNRPTQGRVIITPCNAASAAAFGYVTSQSTSGWTMNLHTPPAGATAMIFDYFVVG